MLHSAVLIIPAALKSQADAVGAAMGWGEVSYTIPLSDNLESLEVTHWAARCDVSEQFMRWIHGLDALPDPAFQPVVDALIADFSDDIWGRAHLDAVLAAQGLHWMGRGRGGE